MTDSNREKDTKKVEKISTEYSEPVAQEPSTDKKRPARKKRKKKHPFLRLLFVVLAIVGIIIAAHLPYFDVVSIAVIGNDDITDEEVVELAGIQTGGSVFDVHPFLVERKIKKNLYIKEVDVSRRLPNKIEIAIKEKNSIAQFESEGEYIITDSDGLVLEIADEPKQATAIEGVNINKCEKGKTVTSSDNEKKLEQAFHLLKITAKNDLYFKKINMGKPQVEAYVYDNLVCRGEYENFEHSIKSGALKSVIYDLYQKDREKGEINVYDNDYCFFTP